MDEKIFIFFVFLIFIYFIYQEYDFQKSIFFGNKEGFTPKEVNNIIQPPGSNPIGTMDPKIWTSTQMKVISNGYTEKQINNLKPSNPSPLIKKNGNYQDMLGDYPTAENGNYILPTTEFGHPNDYKFTVDYPCRKTATGMFTDCGVYSANLAWSANPYKGLQCKLHDTKTPKINNNFKDNTETEYKHGDLKRGISGVGTSMLR